MDISLEKTPPLIAGFVKEARKAQRTHVRLKLRGKTLKLIASEAFSFDNGFQINVIPRDSDDKMYVSKDIDITDNHSNEQIAEELLISLKDSLPAEVS
jgi:hypothetical protein